MPDPTYPEVTVALTGLDGNAFSVVGAVSTALRREVSPEAADAYAHAAMNSPSYDALLRHAMETVNVC